MFEMPPTIKTEVFAKLPDAFLGPGNGGEAQKIKKCILEGPSFDRAGNLYFVDIPNGRIFRISPQRQFELVAQYEGEPNGLKIHKDGRIFIADHKNGLLLLDPASGRVTPFLEGPPKEKFKGLNDLVFAANGDLYFTDQGQTSLSDPTGKVYRLSAQGRLECLLGNIPSPNGIALDPSENTLYVAVTRDSSVWKVELLKNGNVGRTSIFVRWGFGGSPDGLAMDEAGNLAVIRFMKEEIWVFSKSADPICRIVGSTGDEHVTNLAYGGQDNRTLYITESTTGCILSARMEVAGKLMYSHM